MIDVEEIEESINRSIAEDSAMKIKEYCKRHRVCEGCCFYIGICKLSQHPCDWGFEEGRK